MVTTQSAVTIMAEILPGHEEPLLEMLAAAGRDPANNSLAPFGRLPMVHFARFFIMEAATDLQGNLLTPRLFFLADVDGPSSTFISALREQAEEGLSRIYSHCVGFTQGTNLEGYLRTRTIPNAATYVNTRGRSVEQVREEAALHRAIRAHLDRTQIAWRGTSPQQVRAAIQQFVESEPALQWARGPVPKPTLSSVLGEKLHFGLVAAVTVGLFPAIAVGLPFWLFFLRKNEQADTPRDIKPSKELIEKLGEQEDHGVQNPFTSAGYLKPGPFRRFTATLVLWGTNFLARHIFNHGSLIGVKTIHFARWIFIDQKRRVIFCSNYDGSLENYMDDFIDKIAWGLNASFSNGVDYPRTSWLIRDGAHDEQVFKRFNLMHQKVAPFWYAAYQGLTALNIENNACIRAGLYGAMNSVATRAWLRRL